MSLKSTVIMALLAAIGLAAMLYSAQRNDSALSLRSDRKPLLTREQLPIDQVHRITLKRGDEPAMVFERQDHGWTQTQPFAHPMDPFSMRQLVEQALQVEVVEQIDPQSLPANLTSEALRLKPPAATITYEWPAGSLGVELGKVSLAGRAYLRLAGAPAIYIVNQSLHERAAQADPKEWRDRAIFHDVGIESDRIERTEGTARTVLVRDRKTWTMIEPVKTRLDPVARDALLQELGRARVGGFILDQPRDLSRFGLDAPVASISVISNDGSATQRLVIGAATSVTSQDRFGMIDGRDTVVRIPAMTLASVFRKPQNLAAATASGVQPADVKSIIIRHGGDEVRIERELEKWFAPAPAGQRKEVPAAYLDELLNQLTTLKAPDVQFVTYPRDLEIATITLLGFDGKAIDTVRIAQEKDSGRLALENGDNVLRVFPAGMKMRLTAGEFGL